jgi:hypothetical protein
MHFEYRPELLINWWINGSHIKRVAIIDNQKHILTVPNHAELHTGTGKAMIRKTSRYLSQEELYPYFYTE